MTLSKEKRARIREFAQRGRCLDYPNSLSLLDELDSKDAEIERLTAEANSDKRPWAEREAWDEGYEAGVAAAGETISALPHELDRARERAENPYRKGSTP